MNWLDTLIGKSEITYRDMFFLRYNSYIKKENNEVDERTSNKYIEKSYNFICSLYEHYNNINPILNINFDFDGKIF